MSIPMHAFDLSNDQASFINVMADILNGISYKSRIWYLDSILVFGLTAEEHRDYLQEVFDRLQATSPKNVYLVSPKYSI